MITVVLNGGLGNQMFQYAAAKRLAMRHQTQVRLDLTKYRKVHRTYARPYGLHQFALSGSVVGSAIMGRMTAAYLRRRRKGRLSWIRRLYIEPNTAYCGDVLGLPDHTILFGYFQCERYFADVSEQIRQEFQPADSGLHRRIEAVLESHRSGRPLVSVHVRRGDYLTIGRQGRQLPPERIDAAMKHFDDVDFLIFSDDREWCQHHLRGDRVVMSPFKTAIEDLVAMSACDHNIIANSTFSWWGAWLNPNPEKIVLAPTDELADTEWALPADLYPPRWHRY